MKERIRPLGITLYHLAAATVLLCLTGTGNALAAAASSCVTCHTDVEALENTLAPAKVTASANQSGAG